MAYNSRNYYRPEIFGGFRLFPPVVKTLLILNVTVYVMMLFFGAFRIGHISLYQYFVQILGLMPIGYGFYPWQLITYQFVHADFWHLFFNMVFGLWMFGKEVESVWGSNKFLFYYLFCGIVAGLAQLFLSPILESVTGPTIGASGAIYGVLVAFAVMFPNQYIFLYFLIPIKVKYFVALLIIIGILSIGGPTNVANLAHLGGALAGYLYILCERRFSYGTRIWRKRRQKPVYYTWSESSIGQNEVVDAKILNIEESNASKTKDEKAELQKRIDEILDKISRSGYQSLTEEEKKILFEASRKMN